MLLLVALFGIVSGAPAEPRLQAPDAPLLAGDAAAFVLKPPLSVPVHVDGCVAVELEQREAGAWMRVASETRCDGAAEARKVVKDTTFSVPVPNAGEYRGVVAWGVGCGDGRPFALAACKSRGVVRSEAFSVAEKRGTP